MPEYIQYNAQGLIIQKWYSVDPSIVAGLSNILNVDRDTFRLLTKYWIVDNGILRQMTQGEKDQLDLWEQNQVKQTETNRINDLDTEATSDLSSVVLTKMDNAIGNIGSLDDAKAFLKELCRFIIKHISR